MSVSEEISLFKYGKNINILIADDDRLTRSVLRLLLQEHLYTVIGEATDGEKAVEMCLGLKPDIAFLDIDMPKLTGHQAALQIKQDNSDIKVIMISALATASNVQQAMQAGASGFVVKPFNAIKVIEAIDLCLKRSA
ncbi:MAG TPA: response regulator [Oxalobacteraceae bacterium]|nr:response regulator [Oxalobacteraceae bacterium]HCN88166.1 response regulator [Oxalobacteraceae bacterium]